MQGDVFDLLLPVRGCSGRLQPQCGSGRSLGAGEGRLTSGDLLAGREYLFPYQTVSFGWTTKSTQIRTNYTTGLSPYGPGVGESSPEKGLLFSQI